MHEIAGAIIIGLWGGACIIGALIVHAVNVYLATPKNTNHDINLPPEINVVHCDQRNPQR